MSKKRLKSFLGHEISKGDQSALASLIGHTSLTIGIPKRRIKSEQQLWNIVEAMFGLSPKAGEGFLAAVRRIRNAIARMPEDDRRRCRHSGAAKLGLVHRGSGKIAAPPTAKRPEKTDGRKSPGKGSREQFYLSWEWRELRMTVLKKHGARCQCCGASRAHVTAAGSPVRICVDHIQPLSKRWDLRLDPDNLQVLCDECNQGKGAWDTTDWREALTESEAASIAAIDLQLTQH